MRDNALPRTVVVAGRDSGGTGIVEVFHSLYSLMGTLSSVFKLSGTDPDPSRCITNCNTQMSTITSTSVRSGVSVIRIAE